MGREGTRVPTQDLAFRRVLLRASANNRPIDAQPGFDVFLAQILEELLQVADNPAFETFDEFAPLVGNAHENLATIFRVAESFDQPGFDQALDQARGGG